MSRQVPKVLAVALLLGGNAQAGPAPSFPDPVALVGWLLAHSGREFRPEDDSATATVFSPGLRAALRASFARSHQRNEPPCGADGDIILETQEGGRPSNVRLAAQRTEPDRVVVAASFDVDGYHRDSKFMTVQLDGVWKLENIVMAEGISLRRSLACQR